MRLVCVKPMDKRVFSTINQGTKLWYRIRKNCIATSSDFASVLGVSKYKSKRMFWKEKIYGERPKSQYVQRILDYGTEHEESARTLLSNIQGNTIKTVGFYHYNDDKRFGASPDGLVLDGKNDTLVEIKCPYSQKVYPDITNTSIPIHHYIQIQGQLNCANMEKCIYMCWTPYHSRANAVTIDRELWADTIYPELQIFAEEIKERNYKKVSRKKMQQIKKNVLRSMENNITPLFTIDPHTL